MTELSEKHEALESDYSELKAKIIARQKRMKELSELLTNYEHYKPNKSADRSYCFFTGVMRY